MLDYFFHVKNTKFQYYPPMLFLGLVDRLETSFQKKTVRIEPVENQTGSKRTDFIHSFKTSFLKKNKNKGILCFNIFLY